ncbi:MAG: DUF86 domain-containing protein [Geminicoccaceae bacterium]
MSRDPSLYLADIEESCRLILEYIGGLSAKELLDDRKTLDAVIRNMEVIGEAVKRLPKSTADRRPDIEWRKIAGIRDVLIDGYFGIDPNIVWDAEVNKVPHLLGAIVELRTGRDER